MSSFSSHATNNTEGEFNYYVAESRTPMEDGVLVCPFDQPSCLAKNIEMGNICPVKCPVFDGRAESELMDGLVFNTRGIMCATHVSQVSDFWSEEEVLKTHYTEMAALAKLISGADRTAVAAHAVRRQGASGEARLAYSEKYPMARDAAFTVHNDFSDYLVEQFVEMHKKGATTIINESVESGGLGIKDDEELEAGRLSIINFWRPFSVDPLTRNPLAVLDASTIGHDDVVLCRHPFKDENFSFLKHYKLPVPFINTLIRPNPSHKWYYFPGMTRDEVLVFKNYDSIGKMPANGVGMHTSFHDPNTLDSAPPRESIEIRVACFWNKAS
jgi:hypothetical protein